MATLKDKTLACINGHRHRDYSRTVQLAEWCFSMMTGEDQDEALIQYHTKESKEQKEQRVKVTSSKTQFASGNVSKYFNEVHRSDTVVNDLYYQDDPDKKKLDRLRVGMEHFGHGEPLKEWLDQEYFYRQFYDPNSFMIMEWVLNESKLPLPYALNIDAKDVLDFDYKFGTLDFVVIRQAKWYPIPTEEGKPKPLTPATYSDAQQQNKKNKPTDQIQGFEMAYKYTAYGPGQTFELVQLPRAGGVIDGKDYPGFTLVEYGVGSDQVSFYERELEQNIDFTPAIRWGYFRDPLTRGRTMVSPLYPAEKIFTDLQRNKSEYDITKTLHGFYQKFIYVSSCKKCGGTGEVVNKANNALAACKPCKGTGKLSHQSSQDVVAITLPDKPEQMMDLSKLVHFAEIPQYVAEMQKADVDQAVKEIFTAIFSERLFDQNQVQTTAQEARLNLRSMYNALHPYAEHLARMYKKAILAIHAILENQGVLVNNFAITKDYHMETLDDLFDQRQKAVTSSAPQIIIDQIDAKILKKQHQNDPEFLDEYQAIQELKPLRDKTTNETIVIVSQEPPGSMLKTQWTYFNDIIQAMKAENPGVFRLPYARRKLAFEAMAREFQVIHASETPEPVFVG